MATKAYILIETVVGQTKPVADTMRLLSEVKAVDSVTGPYDLIAIVEASDLSAIGELMTRQMHAINGVMRTVTCLVISAD